jgi:predicted MPP superfamily phosphohydrolase
MTSAVQAIEAVSASIPWPLLWLGACLGHAFYMTVSLNCIYALALPRQLLKPLRKIDILIILAGPILFGVILDVFGARELPWHGGGIWPFFAAYTIVCFFLGTVVAPISQLTYWLRPKAPQLTSMASEVVNVAEALGYAPVGNGKNAKSCLLPFNQVFEVEFNEKTFTLPSLPKAWDGLTILHLSDLHFCGTPDRTFFKHVIDQAMRPGVPDIIALTGDIVDSSWHHRWIAPILGRLRCKEFAWAILGNHDHYRDVAPIRRRLRKIGFRVLVNEWEEVTLRGERLIVSGDEYPWLAGEPDVSGLPPDGFRLGIVHTPDRIDWCRKHQFDLVLAGHVHGGQIRVPPIGSMFCPSRHSRKYDCGSFFEPPTVMHVSRGLSGQHPLRFNCRPEVTRLVLKAT